MEKKMAKNQKIQSPQNITKVKRVVLAYSGGLDTSVIVPWLKNNYGCEVICMCANLGQEEELDGLEEKIFIAKYKVKLPSESKIKKAIRKLWTKNK